MTTEHVSFVAAALGAVGMAIVTYCELRRHTR